MNVLMMSVILLSFGPMANACQNQGLFSIAFPKFKGKMTYEIKNIIGETVEVGVVDCHNPENRIISADPLLLVEPFILCKEKIFSGSANQESRTEKIREEKIKK